LGRRHLSRTILNSFKYFLLYIYLYEKEVPGKY
jgi:hypothetical protein